LYGAGIYIVAVVGPKSEWAEEARSRILQPMSDIVSNTKESMNEPFGVSGMSKYEIIDCIMDLNKSAKTEFLEQFTVEELDMYLEHLMEVDMEEVAMCA
jgi:hypothetical protein